MFRKAALATAALIALAGVLTGCGTDNGYTGTAVVKEHHKSSQKCHAKMELPSKEIIEFRMGRSTCNHLTDGGTVTLENGYLK